MISIGGSRRKVDTPEGGHGCAELERNQGAFRSELWRADDLGLDNLLGLRIFHQDLIPLHERLGKDDESAIFAHRVRHGLDGLRFSRHADVDRYAKENALRAASLFRGGRARGYDPRRGLEMSGPSIKIRFHSSSPQKSISGATNSTPYSQPSGRGLPFHTMTAALLAPVARLVSARRCSRSSEWVITTMQP